LGESIDHPNGHAVKTLESKETRAQRNDADNAQFSFCCTSTNAGWRFQDRHPAFSYPPLGPEMLNNSAAYCVKRYREFMRGIIVRNICVEDLVALRHLQAVEGYLDLGMFEEADEELRELDPAWFALEQTVSLQLRVLTGLNRD
jgi:hypothetical protein